MKLTLDLFVDETLFPNVFAIVNDSYASLYFPHKDTLKLSDSEVITLEIMRELKWVNSQKRWMQYASKFELPRFRTT